MNKEKIYLVWQDGPEEQFFNHYDNIEDAVSSEEEPVEIYEALPKFLGKFKVAVQKMKVKKVK